MFAVIKAGGHQYKVKEGDQVTIDFHAGNVGDKLTFDNVLMVGDKVGTPVVNGAKVEATIKDQTRADKILVFKYKRRKGYKKTQGHRQNLTVVEVNKISG